MVCPDRTGELTTSGAAMFGRRGDSLGAAGEAKPSIASAAAISLNAACSWMFSPFAAPLVVNSPVRSGQTIQYLEGDVTIIGSVASGADVIAGGSIHIYGALRGRAFAGAEGEAQARIFCRRLEAELLAVTGVYLTADEIGTSVRGQPVQAWLEQDNIRIARLD